MEVSKINHIFSIIDFNIPLNYKYNKNTDIILFDLQNEKKHSFNIKEDKYLDLINSTKQITSHGNILNNYLQNDLNLLNDMIKENKSILKTPIINGSINMEESDSSEEYDDPDTEFEFFDSDFSM